MSGLKLTSHHIVLSGKLFGGRAYSLHLRTEKQKDMKGLITVVFLVISNSFMTLAWYGHLKFQEMKWFSKLGILTVILLSWGIALFEYMFQVPANRMGFRENGGPFSLMQLKVIQEVITLTVFTVFSLLLFKNENLRMNQLIGFAFLILAVYFMFKK